MILLTFPQLDQITYWVSSATGQDGHGFSGAWRRCNSYWAKITQTDDKILWSAPLWADQIGDLLVNGFE